MRTPLAQFASSFRKPSPYGGDTDHESVELSVSSDDGAACWTRWQQAIQQSSRPSAYSPFTSEIMAKIISECLPQKYVAVVNGGRKENQWLLKEKFDYIFFAGSQAVGKK